MLKRLDFYEIPWFKFVTDFSWLCFFFGDIDQINT